MDLHTVCFRPGGMNRGGQRHERLKTFKEGTFSPEQVRELLNEPEIALISGGEVMGAKHLEEVEAQIAQAHEDAAKAEAERAEAAKGARTPATKRGA